MPKFTFQMGVNARAYGSVEVEATTIEAAVALLTADYVGENISPSDTTWDSLTGLAIIDVTDESGTEIDEYAGTDLPSEYDYNPDPLARHSAETIRAAEIACPAEDWRHEVINCDTMLGYREWLAHKIDAGMTGPFLDVADMPVMFPGEGCP